MQARHKKRAPKGSNTLNTGTSTHLFTRTHVGYGHASRSISSPTLNANHIMLTCPHPTQALAARSVPNLPACPYSEAMAPTGAVAHRRSWGGGVAALSLAVATVWGLASAWASASYAQSAVAPTPAVTRQHVVIQVSDNDSQKWNLALNNAHNVQIELGPQNVDIEIVTYGPGIAMLKAESVVGNRVAEALEAGVNVVACQVSMKGQKLVPQDMLARIGYVPSGVVEIMKRQQSGYSYVRP